MDSEAQLRRELEVDLRDALAQQQFVLHYQTIIDVPSRQVCGVEALVRWNHPGRGLLGPDRFVPIAEELGLIIPIGQWILRQACSDAKAWPEHVKLAVNLSPVVVGGQEVVQLAFVEKSAPCPPLKIAHAMRRMRHVSS